MLDTTDLVNSIKKAAVEAVAAAKPTGFVFGTVTSVSPLKINIEQKMTLTSAQLVLTRNVTDYETKIKVDWLSDEATESHGHDISVKVELGGEPEHTHVALAEASPTPNVHAHKMSGVKKITVYNGLVVGDELVLAQMQGGQKYIVLDRVVNI